MNVLVAVADLGIRALWEGILHDHGHRTLPVSPELPEWREAHTFALDIAIVELTPARPEAFELCRRLRENPAATRPGLAVLVQPGEATEMLSALRATPDDVVLGHPDRRTAMSHLAAMERRRHVARPPLPTAHELASGYDRKEPVSSVTALVGVTAQLQGVAPGLPVWVDEPVTPVAGPSADTQVTVLLIDDEPSVRHPLRLALQHVGYRVIEANDGEEGLEVIARWGDRISVIVADQRMRRVSGLEVLRQVRRRPRRIPVVLMSGYPSLDPSDDTVTPDAFLRKPFELLDLAGTLQRLLRKESEMR